MREIGIRELKASLSEVLRDVNGGQPVRVTRRGRAVADIVPAGAQQPDERIAALVAAGKIAAPTAPLPREAPGLSAHKGSSASDLILEERDAER